MLFALFIVILYFVWNITPQTVIQRGGYFFSESWKIITGRASNQQQMQVVTPKQVQEAQAYIHHKGK